MAMRRPAGMIDVPEYVKNDNCGIDLPASNQGQVDTANSMISRYLETDHSIFVRPLQILVTSYNGRAARAAVDVMLGYLDAYRTDTMNVDNKLGELVERCKILVVDCLSEELRIEIPYMLGKEGVLIWMMRPGDAANEFDADFRIDVKDFSHAEARKNLKVSTHLPLDVIASLLDVNKDVWKIDEILGLLYDRRLDHRDLELIGDIFGVDLCEWDWSETREDDEVMRQARDEDEDLDDDEDEIEEIETIDEGFDEDESGQDKTELQTH